MKKLLIRVILLPVIVAVMLPAVKAPGATGGQPLVAVLNGLRLEIDSYTGSILKMSYPGVGVLAESVASDAGMLDLALPTREFEVLRLASRYSKDAAVRIYPDSVVVSWNALGKSRANFEVKGNVSAMVKLSADPDGQSIILKAKITNHAETAIRQVVFPDFRGLLPVGGTDKTWFRTGNFASLPFMELARDDTRESTPFMIDAAFYSVQYVGSGMMRNKDMVVRWMDLGGLNGGISLFPKRWGWDPQVPVRLRLSEKEPRLQLMCLHDTVIRTDETWESGDWVLTPHRNGWAAGIAPYRSWVKQNYRKYSPMPAHVRDGIGFRTVFMSQYQPADPNDAVFTFRDLPGLAAECRENGLDEMVIWAWCDAFTLPLPKPFAHLGTEQDMVNAYRECKKLGVNLVPFITVLQANKKTAPRYGLEVTGTSGWTYHTELIPPRNPGYATFGATVQAGPLNRKWQEDVLIGLKHLADIGIPSFCWDQFYTTQDPEPNMLSLARQIIDYAKKKDPESTFSGEELLNFELDAGYLDYTWNWDGYMDRRVLTSVFPSPRINSCVSSSPLAVKKAFADNLYLNILPRKAGSVNGSDYIANYPDLSVALKQCARLKKQFLPYFVRGTLIGDCLLKEPLTGIHACSYTLPDSAILVLINTGNEIRKVGLDVSPGPWLTSGAKKYSVRHYNEEGVVVRRQSAGETWRGTTIPLNPNQLTVIEFIGE